MSLKINKSDLGNVKKFQEVLEKMNYKIQGVPLRSKFINILKPPVQDSSASVEEINTAPKMIKAT